MLTSLAHQAVLSVQPQRLPEGQSPLKQFNSSYSKKKIGDYAYYLNDLLGSGYSSQVYKCHHRSEPKKLYAIKVIKLSKISKTNYQFLQNQIKILQRLDHPNIIKFHNVFYTQNNCYIITDYCEGGTLQEIIDKGQKFDSQDVINQLATGCKYLVQKLVMHRDIKPANVFLQGKLWKIGDFGFARYLQDKDIQVKQQFRVGSPLYMPPQTLIDSIYSLKTDSFALGVLFFYMTTKRFPWPGENSKQLQQFYKSCQFPSNLINHLPYNHQNLIRNLCNLKMSQRVLVTNVNLNIKQVHTYFVTKIQQPVIKSPLRKVHSRQVANPEKDQEVVIQENIQNLDIKQYYPDQLDLDAIHRLKLCKFVHYLNINIKQNPQLEYICPKLEKLLKFLITIYLWEQKPEFKKYVQQFTKEHYERFEKVGEIKQLQQITERQINNLQSLSGQKILQITRMKLIQFNEILKFLLIKNPLRLKEFLSKLIIHPDFSQVFMFPVQVQEIKKLYKPKR